MVCSWQIISLGWHATGMTPVASIAGTLRLDKLLIDSNLQVKVAGLGLASFGIGNHPPASEQSKLYWPPEQLHGEGPTLSGDVCKS
jgi:hypothetical protein